MFINKYNLPITISIFFLLISLFDQAIPGARYAKYLIPPVCIILWLYSSTFIINKIPLLLPYYYYIFVSIIYLLLSFFGYGNSDISDLYFVITYILPFFLFKLQRIDVKFVFNLFVLVFVILSALKILSFGTQISIDILNSYSSFEHSEFGFILAFFAIYFYRERNFKLFIVALFFCFLSLKRIALIAVVFGVFVSHTKHIWYRDRYTVPVLFSLLNLIVIFILEFITTDQFNDFSLEYFGVSSNHLLMGRVLIYDFLFSNADFHWLYGGGPGSVYLYASEAVGSIERYLIHSDILKLSAEFGYIFLVTFFIMLYFSSKRYIEYIVPANIVMITDNIFIYASVFFVVILLSSQAVVSACSDTGANSCE